MNINKKRFLITIVLVLSMLAITLVGCGPNFDEYPIGISSDERIFNEIKDKRMDAEAEGYNGYIYNSSEGAFCFRLFEPNSVVEDKVYPMIIFLHGSGDGGSDNSSHMYRSLIESVKKYVNEDVYVFMPQAIDDYNWSRAYKNDETMDKLYNECLDKLLEQFPIDTSRVYLTGMSMGGNGAFYQAYNYPEKYAAVMPVCGFFPEEDFDDLNKIKDMPIYLGHSKTDKAVDFSYSLDLFNKLKEISASDLNKFWLEDYAHDMTLPFYDRAELWDWLMIKKK